MVRTFSPASYRNGQRTAGLVLGYLVLVAATAVGAAIDLHEAGTADGSFWFGATVVATAPLSLLVVVASWLAATVRGVPMGEQDASPWLLAAFVACALVNGLLLWLTFRGRRVDEWDGSLRR